MPPSNPPPSSGKPGDSGGPRPGKADWRGKAKTPAAGSRPSGAKGAVWKDRPDLEYRRAKRRHRMKLIGLLVGSVSLLAWLAYLYVYPLFWRQTPFFAVVVTQYGPSAESLGFSLIPPNGWAQEDADRFDLLGTGDTGEKIADYSRVAYAPWETTLEGFQDLRERIRKSRGGGPGRNAMVLYLSVHGAVNQEGQPCLIPPGVSPLESDKWLPLDRVLRYLFPEEDKSRLPAKKLLIVDCNRIDANWGLGQLYNGFADGLDAARKQADVPGLVILNSTSPGQIGWTSPEQLQGSVFGYYVWRGLMGWADRGGEGNGDGEVSLSELHRYVAKYVKQWVQESRADAQVPMLVPADAEDFPLVYSLTEKELAEGEKQWAPPAPQRDPRWRDVADLWQQHSQLEKQSARRNDPLGWEEFQHGLLRLEQLVQAGAAYGAEFDRRKARLAELAKRLAEDPIAPQVRAYNFPLATRLARDPAIDAEAERLRGQWAKTPGKFAPEAGRPLPYLVAATAAWQWCLGHPEGDRWPDDLLALVEKARQDRKADVVEWHFVRMLQAYLDPEVRKAQPNLVKQALLARQGAELAAAPADVRVHYWLHQLVDAADADRRVAEDALFVGNAAVLPQAQERFAAAAGSDGSGGRYAEARARAKAVADAFALRDRAWARTPYLAQWLLARLNESDPALSDELARLTGATRQLGAELDRELAGQREGASAEAVPSAARAAAQDGVERSLAVLETAYQNECSRLSETTGTDREILRRIGTVLSVPLVTGEDRQRLRRRYLDILESARQAPPGAGPEGAAYRVAADQQAAGQGDLEVRFLKRLARWGQHPALAMLSRAGLQDEENLPGKPAEAESKPSAAPGADTDRAAQELQKKSLARQGGEVRRLLGATARDAAALAQATEAKLRLEERTPPAAETREGLSKADRLLRASAAIFQTELTPWTEPCTDPVARLRRLDLYYLLVWQCHRTLEDFWGPAPGDRAAHSFFDAVAAEYLASTGDLCKDAAGRHYGKWNLSQLLKDRRAAAGQPVRTVVADVQIVPGDPSTPVDAAVSEAANLPPGEAALWLESENQRQVLPLFAAAADAEKPAAAGLRRVKLAVPGQPAKSSYWVRSSDFGPEDRGAASRNYQGVSLYRGHRLALPFIATLPGAGVRIVFQPPQDPKQSITVKGDVKTEAYVVFILDYSGSMTQWITARQKQPQAGNPQGKPGIGLEERRRYEDARGTLLTILTKLAKVPETPYRVGVMVYGHRYNYGSVLRGAGFDVPAGAEFVKRDPKNPSAFISADSDVPRASPSEDVERIWPDRREGWPPGPWTPASAEELRRKLEPLRPMGETPLYLSVVQAIDLLNEAAAASGGGVAPSKHIVVITDGVNYQSDHKTGKADLAEKFAKAGSGIRLDIIGYLLTDESAKKEAEQLGLSPEDIRGAVDDLRALAQSHGGDRQLPPEERGEFYSARDSSSLEKELERSLRLSQYVVYREGATPSDVSKLEPIDLGLSWRVALGAADSARAGGVPMVVKLVDPSRQAQSQVRLEGGEALLLRLSADGQRLEHDRYKFQLREARPDVRDPLDGSRRLYIAAHLPEVRQDAVRFLFSIQNEDERLFSPRPAEAWVEIRPVLKNPEAAPLYVFYDAQFAPECPVPVLECTAPKWPEDAIEAEVRLWCKLTRTPPDEVLRLDQWAPKKRPGVSLELRQESVEKQDLHQVIVVERYPRGGEAGAPRSLSALKVEMDPRPLKAVHHYLPEAGIVRHTFTYPLEPFRSGRVPPYVVRVTLRDEVLKDAIAVDPPLRVTVPRNTAGAR